MFVTLQCEHFLHDERVAATVQETKIKKSFFLAFSFCLILNCPTRLAFRCRPVFLSGHWSPLLFFCLVSRE